MSGTSADGVDGAVVRVSGGSAHPTVELLAHRSVPFAPGLRARILAAAGDATLTAAALARLHRDLGDAYADVAVHLRSTAPGDVAVIGVHGQTVAHLPLERVTLQLGDAARVAARSGIATVADFRSADVAAGGEGAPLTPFADRILFGSRAPCAVLNLGGIANLTLLPDDDPDHVVALDTGPGNMVIDALARLGGADHDSGGAGALRGRVHEDALATALAHPFFARRAPKSAGREEFGEPFTRALVRHVDATLDDALATATELTARTAADALAANTPRGLAWSEILVGGGGARNAALMDALGRAAAPIPVRATDDAGVPAGAREAMAFALLALFRVRGLPNTLPRCTGATRAVCAGAVHRP
ncbi:MAG: anhydro-N-acetylmuramic acid kinase [Chloroflexota bacterium]|nr:anhydro-N-acetylmuramic acid kinase [Chloroflexota bacterium]